MDKSTNDELRIRFIIDREMPDLFARLAGSKRPSREIVHLLRMGINWEMAIDGRLQLFAPLSSGTPIQQVTIASPNKEVLTKTEPKPDIMLGKEFVEITGISADYFAGEPAAYSD